MFAILCAFDFVFHFVSLASYALQLQITNEELLFVPAAFFNTPSLPHKSYSPLSARIMRPSGDPQTVQHNLRRGDLLCLRHFPAETVINLH